MTSWRGSQGAELEAAAHSDVPIANSMGSMGTAAQLPGSTLTVKDLGRVMLSPTMGSASHLHLCHQDNPLQAGSEACVPGESRFHQSDNTDHHKAQ